MGALKDVHVDAVTASARFQAGLQGLELAEVLSQHGLHYRCARALEDDCTRGSTADAACSAVGSATLLPVASACRDCSQQTWWLTACVLQALQASLLGAVPAGGALPSTRHALCYWTVCTSTQLLRAVPAADSRLRCGLHLAIS